MEDDPRYEALRAFVQQELKHIQNKWTDLRNKRGTEEAMQIPAISFVARAPADGYTLLGTGIIFTWEVATSGAHPRIGPSILF